MFEPSRLDSDKNKRIQWQKTDLQFKHNTEYDIYNANSFLFLHVPYFKKKVKNWLVKIQIHFDNQMKTTVYVEGIIYAVMF